MKINTSKFDEQDFTQCRASLESDIAMREDALRAQGKAVPARPGVPDDPLSAIDVLEGHNANLRALCGVARIKTLPGVGDRKLTATEQCLAARGFKSLAEMEAVKNPPQVKTYKGATAKLLEKFDAGTLEELAEKRRSRPACHRGSPPED